MKNACPGLNLDTLPGISQLVCLDEVDSTLNVARELALEGSSEKVLVLAECQTGGRGRMGRHWESSRGGLYMTLLLRPETGLRFLPDLSELSGEVVAEALTSLYKIKTRVKKPNDVYAFHARRHKWLKICGILTEAASVADSPEWLLLGIGVNLNNSVELETGVSVKDLIRAEVNREDFLKEFFCIFWQRYAAWEFSSLSRS